MVGGGAARGSVCAARRSAAAAEQHAESRQATAAITRKAPPTHRGVALSCHAIACALASVARATYTSGASEDRRGSAALYEGSSRRLRSRYSSLLGGRGLGGEG